MWEDSLITEWLKIVLESQYVDDFDAISTFISLPYKCFQLIPKKCKLAILSLLVPSVITNHTYPWIGLWLKTLFRHANWNSHHFLLAVCLHDRKTRTVPLRIPFQVSWLIHGGSTIMRQLLPNPPKSIHLVGVRISMSGCCKDTFPHTISLPCVSGNLLVPEENF